MPSPSKKSAAAKAPRTAAPAKAPAKPAASPPVSPPVAAPAVVPKPPKAAAAPLPKLASRPASKPASKSAPKAEAKPAKPKKPKLVRDSFTIPKPEYTVLDDLKQRSAKLARPAKKSELLRAGIKALAAMSDAAFVAAIEAVPAIKTGRPSAEQ